MFKINRILTKAVIIFQLLRKDVRPVPTTDPRVLKRQNINVKTMAYLMLNVEQLPNISLSKTKNIQVNVVEDN